MTIQLIYYYATENIIASDSNSHLKKRFTTSHVSDLRTTITWDRQSLLTLGAVA